MAAAIAHRLYGFRPSAVTALASEDNCVFRIEFGGMPAKIIKIARRTKPVLHEQAVLRMLRRPRWGFPCPTLEFTQDDLPERWEIDGYTFHRPPAVSVLTFLPGMSLRDAALRGERWAGDAFRAAGALLARLAEIPATQLPRQRTALTPTQIRSGIEPVRDVALRRGFSGDDFERWRQHMISVWCQPFTGLVHGQASARHFLTEASAAGVRVSLLDWETARPGDPLADLAMLLSSFDLPPAPDPGTLAMLQRRAIDGFAATRPVDPEALAAWRIHVALHGAWHFDRRAGEAADRFATLAWQFCN